MQATIVMQGGVGQGEWGLVENAYPRMWWTIGGIWDCGLGGGGEDQF